MSEAFQELIRKDLVLLWKIQDYVYNWPSLDVGMAKIVSKWPWKDICTVIWLFCTIGTIEFKGRHFFLVIMNLAACFIARKLIAAKRPVEYDIRLQPLTDLGEESYGFPSIESYMSVVIMLDLTHLIKPFAFKLLFFILALVVIFLVGFSRIYTRSRFPHQVAGSWILGFIGLILSIPCCESMNLHQLSHGHHWYCVAIVTVPIMVNFALNMENNDSRILYIPKKEFVTVLGNIINGSAKSSVDSSVTNDNDQMIDGDASTIDAKKTITAIAQESIRRRNKGMSVKRDSFYYLQQTMEKRDEEKRYIRAQLDKGEKIDLDSFRSSRSSSSGITPRAQSLA
jgi:membrane-associated phospholipid phosphatase